MTTAQKVTVAKKLNKLFDKSNKRRIADAANEILTKHDLWYGYDAEYTDDQLNETDRYGDQFESDGGFDPLPPYYDFSEKRINKLLHTRKEMEKLYAKRGC